VIVVGWLVNNQQYQHQTKDVPREPKNTFSSKSCSQFLRWEIGDDDEDEDEDEEDDDDDDDDSFGKD